MSRVECLNKEFELDLVVCRKEDEIGCGVQMDWR